MSEKEKQKKSPLLLSSVKSAWLTPVNHGTELDNNKKMKEMRPKILKRDNDTCQYCGWQSDRFQEIHHVNHNHKDFSEKNLKTICPLCHQVFHLSTASITDGGEIIWLPEISQEVLNQICFAIFIAEKSGNKKWEAPAKRLFNSFNSRADFVNGNLVNGASDPAVLAEVLLDISKEEYENRENLVGSLRLLPFSNRFKSQIEYWSATQYKKLPLGDDWLKLVPKDLNI